MLAKSPSDPFFAVTLRAGMSPEALKIVAGLVVLAIVVVAAVPLLVLLDLAAGGTGYGLCPEGLASCRISYATAPELAVTLVVVLFGLLAFLRVVLGTFRRAERHRRLMSGADRLGDG